MSRRRLIVVVAFFLVLLATAILLPRPFTDRSSGPGVEESPPQTVRVESGETPGAPATEESPHGDRILEGYGREGATPQSDIESVSRLLDIFQLLVKSNGALPLGSNEDIVSALTGNNPHRMEFLSTNHPAIDAKGRLVDRWKSPLYFHPVSRDELEIRSAGPDQRMWTEDDIHRNPDGTFRDRSESMPASLF